MFADSPWVLRGVSVGRAWTARRSLLWLSVGSTWVDIEMYETILIPKIAGPPISLPRTPHGRAVDTGLFVGSPWIVHEVSLGRPVGVRASRQAAHGVSVGCPQLVHGVSASSRSDIRYSSGTDIVLCISWACNDTLGFNGQNKGDPRAAQGHLTGTRRATHGSPMGCLWVCWALSVRSPWVVCEFIRGICMGPRWGFHGVSMGRDGSPMGRVWVVDESPGDCPWAAYRVSGMEICFHAFHGLPMGFARTTKSATDGQPIGAPRTLHKEPMGDLRTTYGNSARDSWAPRGYPSDKITDNSRTPHGQTQG